MKQIYMNHTNLKVSELCLGGGCFGSRIEKREVFDVLDVFYEAGGNFIDTARVYCSWIKGKEGYSEKIIGEWIKARQRKNKVVIATKGGHYDFENPMKSRVNEDEVRKDLDVSRKLLGLEVIDLYWIHKDDEEKPIEEIVDFMEKLVREGKIKYYGASNYKLDRLIKAESYAKYMHYQGFSAVSNQWSLAAKSQEAMHREEKSLVTVTREERKWHEVTQIPLAPYSATAGGFFEKLLFSHGKMDSEERVHDFNFQLYCNAGNLGKYYDMFELKNKFGYSFIEISIAYLLQQKYQVFPICGISRKGQMRDILNSVEIKLPQDKVEKWNLD